MNYSNTNLSGKELLNNDAIKQAVCYKINYIIENIDELRLIDKNEKHETFINNIASLVKRGIKLSEAQIRYLEYLFDKILERIQK